jgi:nucleoside-diphosphate-sugar epimerase
MKGRFRLGVPDLWYGIVDVRDASLMHVLAGLNPVAKGRYIAVQGTYSIVHLAEKLIARYGTRYSVSAKKLPKILFFLAGPFIGYSIRFVKRNVGIPIKIDNSLSIKDLGMVFRPVDATLSDQVEQIELDGLIKRR